MFISGNSNNNKIAFSANLHGIKYCPPKLKQRIHSMKETQAFFREMTELSKNIGNKRPKIAEIKSLKDLWNFITFKPDRISLRITAPNATANNAILSINTKTGTFDNLFEVIKGANPGKLPCTHHLFPLEINRPSMEKTFKDCKNWLINLAKNNQAL